MRYKLTIEYDGTDLVGWQRQVEDQSVQGLIEEAIFNFCQEKAEVFAAGRTDAGVHARGQVVHLDLACNREPYRVLLGINQHLKILNAPVAIVSAEQAASDFHARFDAIERRYEYHIIQRLGHLVLERNRAWKVTSQLNINAMREAAKHLIGHHDFSSFRSSHCQAKSPLKTIDEISISEQGDHIIITVRARSFLHHMVRNIVGSLVMIGQEKWQADDIKTVLAARDRTKAGVTAPACGLYFMDVTY